jgi:hypothetical protein
MVRNLLVGFQADPRQLMDEYIYIHTYAYIYTVYIYIYSHQPADVVLKSWFIYIYIYIGFHRVLQMLNMHKPSQVNLVHMC